MLRRAVIVVVGWLGLTLGPGCSDRVGANDDADADAGDDNVAEGPEPPTCLESIGDIPACGSASDEPGCMALNDELRCECEGDCKFCVWQDYVPTTLADDGTCSFGPVDAACVTETVSIFNDGCYGETSLCGELSSWVRYQRVGDTTELVRAPFCLPSEENRCEVDADGVVAEGLPPECACACDPAFPG